MTNASTLSVTDFLAGEAVHVEAALERAVGWITTWIDTEVADAVAHGVLSGGKRLRPILFAAAYRGAGGEGKVGAVYDTAAALELIHAYSLMHDDLPCMDDAELRRGRPTTHRLHGPEVTVRAGAALIPAAARQALLGARSLGMPEERAREVVRLLMQAAGAGGMVGGQALDLLGEERLLTAPELDELHRHKTGALLTAAVTMGSTAAGAGPDVVDAFRRYGEAIGLAFQVADDLLDATSTADQLGKEPSDAELGKSTYVALFGLDEARRRGLALVSRAKEALADAGVSAAPLVALADYTMDRRR
jgi:geranylgeranyl pyrophosphate synthase